MKEFVLAVITVFIAFNYGRHVQRISTQQAEEVAIQRLRAYQEAARQNFLMSEAERRWHVGYVSEQPRLQPQRVAEMPRPSNVFWLGPEFTERLRQNGQATYYTQRGGN